MWSNYQSRFLSRGDYGDHWHDVQVEPQQLWSLYENSQLDWIGTTETLSQTTIPLVTYLVADWQHMKRAYNDPSNIDTQNTAQQMRATHNITQFITVEHLNATTGHWLSWAHEHVALDQALWNWARHEYAWDMHEPDVIRVPCSEEKEGEEDYYTTE